MRDFVVEYEFRKYNTFLESSVATPERLEVKLILYKTEYHIYKDKATNTWHNHTGKFEFSLGLLKEIGQTLDGFLQ
ncbi:hypothetical protein WG906_08620 [Pedobacter sp. P351]|uniref:hypothetical protein n=1 Tax=Pedobacter superstes TaxID=3133441 RepID=UPI0030B6659B